MTNVDASNWMSGLDDATPIHQLSIPGSHESCSRFGGSSTECQDLTITQQLERGVRFLDVRCKYVSDDDSTIFFPIHHYNYYQNITFSEVQSECISFLDDHPGEVILMNVQQEEHYYTSDPHYLVPGPDFELKFIQLIDPTHWAFPNWQPTLQQVRTRILLIRTYNPAAPKGWPGGDLPGGFGGIEWNGFDISGTSSNAFFETQNGWDAWNGSDKGAKVEEYLAAAAAGTKSPNLIYLNFLSHTQGTMKDSSLDMNKRISGYLTKQLTDHSKRLGVLPMDFVGNTGGRAGCLEDLIIQHNRFKAGVSYSYGTP